MRTRQQRSSSRKGSSWPALLLLLVGVGALTAAVLHPAASVIGSGSAQALSGSGNVVLIPGEVVVQSTGLMLVSVASTVIGAALAIARLV
jgi:hypothetical protein